MFLKIKRGERLNKEIFPEPWQSASNDEIAQLLYSSVYQNPGTAKNSKSKLLSNDKTYNKIFSEKYSDDFFVSLQHLKVHYSNWKKQLAKTEPKSSDIYGLSKSGDLLAIASISFIVKIFTNKSLQSFIDGQMLSSINYDNETFKEYASQNDIGSYGLLKTDEIAYLNKRSLMPTFDYIFRQILCPSFRIFKSKFPLYSFSQFNKTARYYYDFVVPTLIKEYKEKRDGMENVMSLFFDLRKDNTKDPTKDDENKMPTNNLHKTLLEYRKKKMDQGIKGSEVFAATQLSYLELYLPRTTNQLKEKCNFKDEQIRRFGSDIIKIIDDHCKIWMEK